MKILILSFYYFPDLCAGSFRCTALVEQLRQLVGENVEIDVLTTRPNRYASFNAEALELERQPGVTIRRIALPAHCSGMLDQARAFVHFAREANHYVKHHEYELVFATSSRLMTAALGAWIARKKKAVLYLDIRDIFVDTLHDVLPKKIVLWAKPMFSILEKLSFNRAQRINLVSKGFSGYFKTRYSASQLSWFTNGIDAEFIISESKNTSCDDDRLERNNTLAPLTILYAGNMGEGQGLHFIIPALAKRMEGLVQFKLIGDGGRKPQLQAALQAANCYNVELLPPMSRQQLIHEYQQADVLFLHLNDYPAFRKVLPSKLFEYGATGKPIWAGVAGYPAEFIHAELPNAAVFYPCNASDAEAVFSTLDLNPNARKHFIKKFSRNHIMQAMAGDILTLL